MEKNAKKKNTKKIQKKKQCFSKSFTSYLHNGSTSEHNSTRFRKLQCRATTFILTTFGNWSCDHPNIPSDKLRKVESSLSSFFTVWSKQVRFPFWVGPWIRPWRWCLTSYILFNFSNFLAYFVIIWLFLDRLPYLEIDPRPWKCYPTSSPTMSTMLKISVNFLPFSSSFLNRSPYLEIDPGPWKCYPTSSPISPNFFWFFCYFISYFSFK